MKFPLKWLICLLFNHDWAVEIGEKGKPQRVYCRRCEEEA